MAVLYVEDGYVADNYTQTTVTINWSTLDIFIPKFYLTLIGGALYSLDTYQLKKDIDDIMDDPAGMVNVDPIKHTGVTTLSGIPYARFIEIINNYTVTFEDGQYSVSLIGSNNNIADVKTVNQVSVIPNNSAGLIDNTAVGADTYMPTWDSQIGIVGLSQNSDALNVSWGSATDNSGVRYRIYISKYANLLFTNGSLIREVDRNSDTIRTESDGVTLLGNFTYFIGITAIDGVGNETDNVNYLSSLFVPISVGVLTQEQHDKLMESSSKSDVINASFL
ncbi:MAG: hypothetical protein GQ570_11830 [Helicobacteraceae bacterium]|nr:hypothetical protein [Helicobacteraceae bacterium]